MAWLSSRIQRPTGSRAAGVSLLEILISIGVVGIGLLGVAALIPLAHYKATEGVREERKALFGKRAFRDFTTYGFDHVGTLTRPMWNQSLPNQIQNLLFDPTTGAFAHRTYVFDPHWVSATRDLNRTNGHAFLFPDNTYYPPGNSFPIVGQVDINIPRVELRVSSNAYLESQLLRDPSTAASAVAAANVLFQQPLWFTLAETDEMFRMRDDLVLNETQENPNDVRRANYLVNGAGLRDKMISAGSFSWMATLVPELKNDIDFGTHPTNRYLMSVVVFNQRDFTGQFREEVIAQVTGGLMEGPTKAINIREIDAENTVKENVGVKDIRAGDWIALYQKQPLIPASGNVDPHLKTLKWYQVISADEVNRPAEELNASDQLTNGIDPTRELTLNGPDWSPINDPLLPVYAIYLRNVVSVYEKTIELRQ